MGPNYNFSFAVINSLKNVHDVPNAMIFTYSQR